MSARILIVDDKPVNIQIISRYLSVRNFQIESAESGEEAIEKAPVFKPDIVLMDICMPEMDGIECAIKLNEILGKENVKLIFISALKDQEVRRRAFEAGAVSFYNKPIDLKRLLATIQSCAEGEEQNPADQEKIIELDPAQNAKSDNQKDYGKTSSVKLIQNSKLRDLGAISSSIAHDINNFLGGILGNVSLIELSTGDEEILACCSEIKKAVESTSELTGKMTSYSKKDTGNKKVVNISETLKDAVNLIERDDSCKAVLEMDLKVENLFTEGVYSEITNVIVNLLKNAYQAAGEKGKVKVALDKLELRTQKKFTRGVIGPGKYSCIKIEDNGVGIPQNVMKHIFEPFFTTKEEGTGLGLSSVIKFIEVYGGAMQLDTIVKKGTVICVYLPLCKSNGEVTLLNLPEQKNASLRGKKIVVMDDDRIFNSSLVNFLKKQEASVVSFTDCKFNEFLEENPGLREYDYLIMDYQSDDIDTFETIKTVNKENPNISSFIISGGEVDLKDVERCSFLKKPVKFDQLVEVLL